MEPIYEYTKLGWFNHQVDVHFNRILYRFRARTSRGAFKKARRYMQ